MVEYNRTPSEKHPLLAVVGPTASGKTSLAVQLAKKLGGEIVSCDSMQVYRGMDIGTAKPSLSEREGIPHHLIDIADPHTPFSCADYVQAAKNVIPGITSRGALPIFCGGTGLYLDALLRGELPETPSDPALRQSLFDYAATYGNHALHARLTAVDPESAAATHENNVKRVVRALEIYELCGMTKTECDRRTRLSESPYRAVVIGLRYENRETLYSRIDRRVDEMLAAGLYTETETLLRDGVFDANTTAAQAIGYKELLPAVRGEEPLSDATERLKLATRHYAKRQMTWFSAKSYVHWIPMEQNGIVRSADDVLAEALLIWEREA